MKILLAIDGSAHSEASVREIARVPAGSEVRVISVIEPIPPTYAPTLLAEGLNLGSYEEYEEMSKTARDRARAVVDEAAATIRADAANRPLTVTTEVHSGSPKNVILEAADAFGADLIVVGSHGHGMLERCLLGSVAQAVALHATCSVEIVRRPTTQAGK
jgi:nucleotide-binding universal stress UspA family protein